MKTVLVLVFSDLGTDPRVGRQLRFLRGRYRVIALGMAPPREPGVEFIECLSPLHGIAQKAAAVGRLTLRQFEAYYWSQPAIQRALRQLSGVSADLIIANDIDTLPLALRIGGDAKILFDAHEYTPREFEDLWWWRLFFQRYRTYLCRTYLPRAHAMTTVCDGIAREYRTVLGVSPTVITNASEYRDIRPQPTDAGRIRLIHHGLALPGRNIEAMLELDRYLDGRFELNFMIPGNSRYLQQLKDITRTSTRTFFPAPVSLQNIIPTIAAYDIGIYLLPPSNFNNQLALPNKFFEFLQARLALAIGPSPEMAAVVKATGCGVVADDFSPRGFASLLNHLSAEQIDRYKSHSALAARRYSSDHNQAVLMGIIDRLLAG